ncbi:MAG: molybdenum cofactor biosynthesis protein B [Haloferacaceae archaeon]
MSDHDHDDHGSHGHREHDDHGHDDHDHDDHGHQNHDHGQHGHGHDDHHDDEHHAHDVSTLGVGVVTISSSRSVDEDPSGDAVVDLVEAEGHGVVAREVVGDDRDDIRETVDGLTDREAVDLVVTSGGTGVTPDDVTPEAVRPLLDRELPGFGELFRRFSYEEIGTMVVGTRAIGGVADETPVFCLPGSENAVRLGVGEIVLPEAGHLVGLARRD